MISIRTQRTLRAFAFAYVVAMSVLAVTAPIGGEWHYPAALLCIVLLVALFPWWLVGGEPELADVFADVTVAGPRSEPPRPDRGLLIVTALAVAGINALGFLCYALFARPLTAPVARGVVALAIVIGGPAILIAALVYGMLSRHSAAT